MDASDEPPAAEPPNMGPSADMTERAAVDGGTEASCPDSVPGAKPAADSPKTGPSAAVAERAAADGVTDATGPGATTAGNEEGTERAVEVIALLDSDGEDNDEENIDNHDRDDEDIDDERELIASAAASIAAASTAPGPAGGGEGDDDAAAVLPEKLLRGTSEGSDRSRDSFCSASSDESAEMTLPPILPQFAYAALLERSYPFSQRARGMAGCRHHHHQKRPRDRPESDTPRATDAAAKMPSAARTAESPGRPVAPQAGWHAMPNSQAHGEDLIQQHQRSQRRRQRQEYWQHQQYWQQHQQFHHHQQKQLQEQEYLQQVQQYYQQQQEQQHLHHQSQQQHEQQQQQQFHHQQQHEQQYRQKQRLHQQQQEHQLLQEQQQQFLQQQQFQQQGAGWHGGYVPPVGYVDQFQQQQWHEQRQREQQLQPQHGQHEQRRTEQQQPTSGSTQALEALARAQRAQIAHAQLQRAEARLALQGSARHAFEAVATATTAAKAHEAKRQEAAIAGVSAGEASHSNLAARGKAAQDASAFEAGREAAAAAAAAFANTKATAAAVDVAVAVTAADLQANAAAVAPATTDALKSTTAAASSLREDGAAPKRQKVAADGKGGNEPKPVNREKRAGDTTSVLEALPAPNNAVGSQLSGGTSAGTPVATVAAATAAKATGKPFQGEKPKQTFDGPAPDIGPGWTMKKYCRRGGATKDREDRYWFSPRLKKKFRSKAEIRRFKDALARVGMDDEATAWKVFKKKLILPDAHEGGAVASGAVAAVGNLSTASAVSAAGAPTMTVAAPVGTLVAMPATGMLPSMMPATTPIPLPSTKTATSAAEKQMLESASVTGVPATSLEPVPLTIAAQHAKAVPVEAPTVHSPAPQPQPQPEEVMSPAAVPLASPQAVEAQ